MVINLVGDNMAWFDIIKVEDIDFDNAISGFGHYAAKSKELNPSDWFQHSFSGNSLKYKDILDEEIRINPAKSYDYLKDKLEREPTDKELSQWIIRIIMHEGTHAGMAEEQLSMAQHQSEYGAFTGQFPESTYLRLKSFLRHPATEENFLPPMLQAMLGIKAKHTFRTTERVEEIITFIDGVTQDLPDNKMRGEIREQLARLEITARQQGKPEIRETNFEDPKTMHKRYGDAFLTVYEKIIDEMEKVKGGDLEKITGAVSSTTAGMESRPRYNKKKEDEEYA